MTYPTISVRQPHASLIFAIDEPSRLIRDWAPTALIGRSIAVHAAAAPLVRNDLRASFDAHCTKHLGMDYDRDIPFGAILGTIKLVSIVELAPDLFEWTLEGALKRRQPLLYSHPGAGARMWRTQL